MTVSVIVFLVLVCRCQAFSEQTVTDTVTANDGVFAGERVTTLREQEINTEKLLREQEDKWATLLRKQDEKWTALLRKQDEKWTALLRKHEEKWTAFLQEEEEKRTFLVRDEKSESTSTSKDLTTVKSLLRQQEQKLRDQDALLRQQGLTLSHQERLLQKQGKRLSHLEALCRQQESTLQQTDEDLKHQSSPNVNWPHSQTMPGTKTPVTSESSDATPHDVMPRAATAGPLEAVVNRISQQVTVMEADIQAMKTTIANDFQTFKTQTDNDLNVFQAHTNSDIQTLKNSNTQQDLAIQDAQSSTFVHWGSSTCTNLSDTVYSGVVGGVWVNHYGAASDYLCLTMAPVFHNITVKGYLAYLYGAEYETADSHRNKDPVCAVCRSTLSTTVMIPGTNVCTAGWHLQYSGFLMTGYYGQEAGSEYICVDSNMEKTAGGDADKNGAALRYTVARCGSLPCSPYVEKQVVMCAVCSK